MASCPAEWDRRAVQSRASHAEQVTALYEPDVVHPSLELVDYRTEFRLLGPLEVVHRGRAVLTGGQRKRAALLACLLLEANRTVSVDALVDALWGERVPSTAVTRSPAVSMPVTVVCVAKVTPARAAASAYPFTTSTGRAWPSVGE